MGADEPSDDTMSRVEFNETLRAHLVAGFKYGIDVEGGWECRNGDDTPDWDVVVVEMLKPNE